MRVVPVHLDDELARRFDVLSKKLGLTQAQVLRDAIQEKIEELEEMSIIMDYLEEEAARPPTPQLRLVQG